MSRAFGWLNRMIRVQGLGLRFRGKLINSASKI